MRNDGVLMKRVRTASFAAVLLGAMSLGGAAVQAQSPSAVPSGPATDNSAMCVGLMNEMVSMMRQHMGAGTMGPGSSMGPVMMGPGASSGPGMMGPGSSMGPGMMGPGSSPAAGGAMRDECLALMDEMMGMMRQHMGMQPGAAAPTPTPAADSHSEHHQSPAPSVAPGASAAAAVRVEVTLASPFRIEPAVITVPAGRPVTFVVTNTDVIAHDFFVGDEAAQAAHDAEMRTMGTMAHDEPNAIGVEAGQTKELTMTFATPGETLAGCHVPGHYAAGMKATILIMP
jgi:uncharacterized cupredoxin-like copper-binding protein